MDKISNNWRTPSWLFDELNVEFNFFIDLCATKLNSKCEYYCVDYLNDLYKHLAIDRIHNFKGNSNSCFMNPPYSNPKPFIEKAWEDSRFCRIVCLVKCDPSTKWWATFWDYNKVVYCKQDRSLFDQMHQKCTKCKGTCRYIYNGPKPGCEVRFFPKRIDFDPPLALKAWKEDKSWKCECDSLLLLTNQVKYRRLPCTKDASCQRCKGKLVCKVPGPNFGCALVIFDRRGL